MQSKRDKELEWITSALERTNENLSKMNIFGYDTLDEADPKHERIRGDVTIEIGGPSTHIRFAVQTRAEHTIIKNAVESILNSRLDAANTRLETFCLKYGKH